MEMYFYGAGNFGKIALDKYLKSRSMNNSLKGFIDNKKRGSYEGYPILRMEDIEKKDIVVVITVQDADAVCEIYYSIKNRGITNIFWFIDYSMLGDKISDFFQTECIECSEWGDVVLPQAEMHIADHCNLNCKGCSHFSPIFEKGFPEYDLVVQDISLLMKKVSSIARFSVLGGEPFLNPMINKYIKAIRRMMPDTCIQIVTNGLLIPNLEENVLRCIKDNRILVSISEYEPTHKMIDHIRNRLEEYKISYKIRPYQFKQKFNKPLSLKKNSEYTHCCISNGCVNIWKGKIARCPTLMYIEKFNEVFSINLPKEGIMDLKTCPEGFELLDLMRQEVPLCQHCICCEIEWEQCGKQKKLSDFAVDE